MACQKNPHFLGKEIAARRLEKVLSDSTYVLMRGDTLVEDERTAVLNG